MIGREIEGASGADIVRFVRALGQHRYVASRLHLVHAFAIEAASAAAPDHPALAEASAWAAATLSDAGIERDSRDERLCRRASDAELVAVLAAFWTPGDARERAGRTLCARLEEIGLQAPDPERLPFDEAAEEDIFPLLVDAGWELLPLAALDPERHKGAIAAFDDALAFEVARFDEDSFTPEAVPLHELPALGAVELLAALDPEGNLRAPFVLWASGHEVYLDYVLRGVLKVAKVTSADA